MYNAEILDFSNYDVLREKINLQKKLRKSKLKILVR